MADEQDNPEVIRRQMEAQRASLAEKLDVLENKIVETVEGAREAVAETVQTVRDSVKDSVETVRDTVQSSVENVKETFDIRHQVQQHPWAMFGGAVAAGFAAGWLLNRMGQSSQPAGAGWSYSPSAYTGRTSRFRDEPGAAASFAETPASAGGTATGTTGESWLDHVAHMFAPEMQKVKGLAIGAAAALVRDLLTQSVPDQLRPQVTDMIDGITTKLGGERLQGDLLSSFTRQDAEAGNGHRQTSGY